MINGITMAPIGYVHNDYVNSDVPQSSVKHSIIEILPQYAEGLLRLREHSHIWVIGWFHESQRDILSVVPKINPDLPPYGVFGIRAYNRPNPIAITAVKLERIDGNLLTVTDLDFFDETPVLDIKPYFDADIIFSPECPYIRPANPQFLQEKMVRRALAHHQEQCPDLMLGVKMALAAEKELGQLASADISVTVKGSRCLGDVIQGLTHARLSNPPRLTFDEREDTAETVWQKEGRIIRVTFKPDIDLAEAEKIPAENLFAVEFLGAQS